MRAGTIVGERFAIVRCLGRGGMGVVYEALDRSLELRVALKTIEHTNASTLHHFKREFRALADVTHRNLVALYELFSAPEETFFTMELVDGEGLLEHVRPGARLRTPDAAPDAARPGTRRVPIACDPDRLVRALLQLSDGLVALHAAGKLHRDIKPSNVLVAADGRVVLLDFGLAIELGGASPRTTLDVAGTAEYMAPEQATGELLTEAADWYAVGSILYEALTGRVPFNGPPVRVVMMKAMETPPAPVDVAEGVPEALSDLCMRLLRPNPSDRPSAREVVALLGGAAASPSRRPLATPPRNVTHAWVGREPQLARMREAFAQSGDGRLVAVHVHGASGMGKSALVRRLLDEVQRDGDAGVEVVILRGRCHERESIPYKAFDGVIDELTHVLRRLPPAEVAGILPRDVLLLARVFPAFARVEAVANAPRRVLDVRDPNELRRRAFASLKELFARLALRYRVVVWIDDLQWGDADSAVLLAELFRPPDPAPLFFLGCDRSNARTSGVLAAMAACGDHVAAGSRLVEIALGPLSPEEADALGEALLGDRRDGGAIAREAAGSPLFVEELVRFFGRTDAPLTRGSLRLTDVLFQRIAELPSAARRLLDVLAVAGRPVPRAVAVEAAGLTPAEARAATWALRDAAFAQAGSDELDATHDRIRAAVIEHLPAAEIATTHRRLAAGLAAHPGADPEALVVHLHGAGDLVPAAEAARAAGDRATAALAFERAASMYRAALDYDPPPAGERHDLAAKLADALAKAGRGAEAAYAYLDASFGAPAARALELHRRAADAFLRSGHVAEGLEMIQRVLAAVGLRLARTPTHALLAIIYRQIVLAVRGLGYTARAPSDIPERVLTTIDVCWTVNTGLAIIDNIRAVDFQKRQILYALRAGEPYRVARALATETLASAVRGSATTKRTARVREAAFEAAARSDNPHARAFVVMTSGLASFLEGRWKDGLDEAARAETIFREECSGVFWELGNSQLCQLWCLAQLGEWKTMTTLLAGILAEAKERGDLYLAANARLGRIAVVWLGAGDPTRAFDEAEIAMRHWPAREVHLQHYYALVSLATTDVYLGGGARALARIDNAWRPLARAMVFRLQNVRIEATYLRGRAALVAARDEAEPAPLLARARKDAGRLARERTPWARALSWSIRAGVAAGHGDAAGARDALMRALAVFESTRMKMHAAAVRRRLAELSDEAARPPLLAAAQATMSAEEIRDPVAVTDLLVPAFLRSKK